MAELPAILDGGDEPVLTQFYQPGAIYCLTPTSEKLCRQFTDHNRVQPPVTVYELPEAENVGPVRENKPVDVETVTNICAAHHSDMCAECDVGIPF